MNPTQQTIAVFALTKGLTFETSAQETLYGGQFVLSTQLIKTNYLNCGELHVCKDGLN